MDPQLAALCSSGLYVVLSVPSIIYCGYQLHRHWNEQYLIKRRISIITAFYVLVSLDMTFLGLSAISHVLWRQHMHLLSKRIIVGVDYTLILAMALIFASRVWLL